MSHEITDTDKVATTGEERAWHKLDSRLPDGLTAEEAFKAAGLGWETRLRPLFFEGPDGARHEVKGTVIQTREDNLAQLGVVSEDYQKCDNLRFAQFVDSLVGVDAALKVETVGSFFGGRRIFVSTKVPRSIRVTRDDVVNLYLSASMGHGGFAGLNVYPTSVRIVCDNTLRMSERDLGRGIRFSHLGDLDAKMKQAQLILGLLNVEAQVFEERIKTLAGAQLTPGQLDFFLDSAFTSAFGKMPDPKQDEEAFKKLEAKRISVLAAWRANLENERNALPGIRGSAWAAFNAVSEWHDHTRGNGDSGSPGRVHSNLFGVSHAAKTATFKTALALAKS